MSGQYRDPHGWELIDDIRAGRPGAFDEFYQRYARSVGAIVTSRCSNPDAVEDIVQETFIRAWRHIGDVRAERGSPIAWLAVIAGNLVRDYRKNGWMRKVIIADHTADMHDPSGAVAALTGGQYLDSYPVEDEAVADLVRPLVATLSVSCQQVLGGLLERARIADEAARLGITEAAVRAARHRALRELRRRLYLRGVRSVNDALDHSGEGWAA